MTTTTTLPDDINSAAKLALRHYVPFSYYARSQAIMNARNGVAQPCVCSAFVMRARDIWFLVTAGHVLDGIDEERRNGLELVNFRLWDGWGPKAKNHNYLPFDFDAPPKFRLNRDGLDYGLIPLSQLLVENLMANGVVPIGEEQFEKNWPEDFGGYAMIGTPGATVQLTRWGERSTKFNQSICIIHLFKETSPPSALIQELPRFYARILMPEDSPEWQLIGSDIRGMSGGPVIGVLRDNDGLRYWIIGVQSGWLASQRIIAACPFQQFARFVGEMLDDTQ